MFNTQILAGSSGQGGETQQSLKFNDDESQYLSWTPAAAGNRKTWTWSAWVKRGNVDVTVSVFGSGPDSNNQCFMIFASSGVISFRNEVSNSIKLVQSTALFRDPAAWYHIVAVYDSTNSTSADRMRLYVNGERITDFSNEVQPSQNLDSFMNSSSYEMFIGRQRSDASSYFEGYMSDIHFIDGQALDASSFGETVDGYWKKKDYAGTYGTNGFHLTFQDDVVSEGFNTVTYRGNGGTQSLSGLGLAADLVWIKERSSTSGHVLTDTVRGANKHLVSSSNGAETTVSNGLTSFDADGFSVGSNGAYNQSGETYVAWAWDAGSGSAASNTDGSITSSVKANPDYGFSIVSYTGNNTDGATVGHGLNQAPELMINKSRDLSQDWYTFGYPAGPSAFSEDGSNLRLNTTAAIANSTVHEVSLDASVITFVDSGHPNGSGDERIAYCFHSVAGYSSIGSYSGTGSANNAVTGLGFKPAWIMIKNATDLGSSGESWYIFDNTRDTVNPAFHKLNPNSSDAESTSTVNNTIDFTSDGFDINTTNAGLNYNGDTYIYMAFADTREAAFWKDVSGQGNHWTPNNLDYRDSLPDSPANNFATLNSTDNAQGATFSEGNLRAANASATDKRYHSTFGMNTGKWYWEVSLNTVGTRNQLGIWSDDDTVTTGVPDNYAYLGVGHAGRGTSGTYNSGAVTASVGDVLCFSFDADNGELYFAVNGTPDISSTASFTGLASDTYLIGCRETSSTVGNNTFNFGQDSTFAGATTAGGNTDANNIGDFKYAPPSGFLALCTSNLTTPTIVDGSEYFNTVTYTGTGTTNPITVGFAPDWTWIKKRNTSRDHQLLDIVRGYTNNILYSNLTNAEDVAGAARIDSRDVDGFTVSGPDQVNGNGDTFAAWNWKAGGTAVSNTAGSITSQVSANTDAGFSIVSYTGTGSAATIGHGLGVAPDLVIVKCRSNAISSPAWPVWHKDLASTAHYLDLQTTAASASAGAALWNNTAPTSSVFSVGTTSSCNSSGFTYVSYLFHSVEGYSKVGSYTGNGSSDGPFVYTGFRPAFWMMKSVSDATHWVIYDSARETFNAVQDQLLPNEANAEAASGRPVDFLSNGVKIRFSSYLNDNGQTYIYLAFAENPFKYANAR